MAPLADRELSPQVPLAHRRRGGACAAVARAARLCAVTKVAQGWPESWGKFRPLIILVPVLVACMIVRTDRL
jgi:hypothetical protein